MAASQPAQPPAILGMAALNRFSKTGPWIVAYATIIDATNMLGMADLSCERLKYGKFDLLQIIVICRKAAETSELGLHVKYDILFGSTKTVRPALKGSCMYVNRIT